jgi:uncharacterized integral membrane protein
LRSALPEATLSGMRPIVGWIVIALTALFVVFNLEKARVWFFGIRAEMPIAFVVIASAVLGAVASSAFSSLRKKG